MLEFIYLDIYSGTFILCCWLFRVLLMSEWGLLFPWPFYSCALLRIKSSHSEREVGEHVNPRQNVNESFRMRQKFTIVTGLITESDIENVCFLLSFLLYGCAGLCCYYNILKTSWYAFETPFVPYKIWLDHVNLLQTKIFKHS